MRHEVFARERISNSYAAVREEWLEDPLGILQYATTTGLSGLFGARLRVLFGPLELASEIVVDLTAIEQRHEPDGTRETRFAVEWGAMRSPELFPIMQAVITIRAVKPTETALEIHGSYRPPLGALGAAADTLAMHHIVEQSVGRFLADIARLLSQQHEDARPGAV